MPGPAAPTMPPIENPSWELSRALDEQRTRISRNLHDLTAQQIALVKIQLGLIRKRSKSSWERTRLDRIIADVDRLAESLHDAVTELRPALLEAGGLACAIQELAETWSCRTGIVISVALHGGTVAVETETASALYYVVQEALTNIAKHAPTASQVSIMLQQTKDRIVLSIENDGIGFVSQEQSGPTERWGLIGLRERITLAGGILEVSSNQISGTNVTACIPRKV